MAETRLATSLRQHPLADTIPAMQPEEWQEFIADVAARGIQVPIEITPDYVILDGRHRWKAAKELGLADVPVRFVNPDAPVEYMAKAATHRRHLTPGQRAAMAVALLPALEEEAKKNQATSSPGVYGGKPLTATLPEGVIGESREKAADIVGASARYVSDAKRIQEDAPDLFEQVKEASITIPQARKEMARRETEAPAHVGYNSGNNEWYTPKEYIDAARAVMGGIDLDPASTEIANGVVGATAFYTAEQDGLMQEWRGRVFMNPPYAQPLIQQFCEKLVASPIEQAIILVNNATETAWFQALAKSAACVCFPRGRVRFWSPDRESAPLQGQAVLYIGKNRAAFLHEFASFGLVMIR